MRKKKKRWNLHLRTWDQFSQLVRFSRQHEIIVMLTPELAITTFCTPSLPNIFATMPHSWSPPRGIFLPQSLPTDVAWNISLLRVRPSEEYQIEVWGQELHLPHHCHVAAGPNPWIRTREGFWEALFLGPQNVHRFFTVQHFYCVPNKSTLVNIWILTHE